ncbi:MAG: NAD(P)H-dependent oxidoreductase subunit E [Candidatus Poribacteria bacterium]|nr:NAD(P)H-dependent oxidoreductase subunit E [Candidatus Poribacteria bacterium]
MPTNAKLIADWRDAPAPLLSILHAFHDRDGFISETSLRDIAIGFRIPLAELFGTLTFYHHFAREAPGQSAPRVCTGPVCRLQGGLEILEALKTEGATPMPCAGRCDDCVPVLKGHQVLTGKQADALSVQPTPLPPPYPGDSEECIFAEIREPNRRTLEGYQRTGGYEGLKHTVTSLTSEEVIDILKESQLAGRGGAGFPTGMKWESVLNAPGDPKTIVCNADEGEPGCFKDRVILDYAPHTVIEGMTLAAYATGATRGFIYLRYEYPETLKILEQALAEAEAEGLIGDEILGKQFSFHIYIRRGAGAYVCGEEGSLLNSLEGKHPFPRNRPPYPVTHGFENLPTVVNNVETLAAATQILRHGAEWYKNLSYDKNLAGTKIISLSGDIQRPGNYEVPFGLPLKTLLYEWAGGPLEGHSIQAITSAGLSGGFIGEKDLDITIDEPSFQKVGAMLGAAGIMVFDDTRDMLDVAHNAMEFFAEESCGKCFPCRIGTHRLTELLSEPLNEKSKDLITEIGAVMKATSACGLGTAAPNITETLMRINP